MSSPITMSGFNQIDFGMILEAIMKQERLPVAALEAEKLALERQKTAFGSLATKLASLESAVEGVAAAEAFDATAATVSDPARMSVSAGASTPQGSFEMFVDQLARAQASSSVESFADKDTTLVAGAGTLRISTGSGDVDVTVDGDKTLQGLADAINAEGDSPVSASIVRNTLGRYELMLTGKSTGEENTFTIDPSALTGPGGGPPVLTFEENQSARDAEVRVNGVTATSATNTFDGVINGLTFTALKADTVNPVTVTITANHDSVVNLVQKLVAAFNDTTAWTGQQTASAARSETNSIGRDPLVRALRGQLTSAMNGAYDVGGSFRALPEVGFEFQRNGELKLNETAFRQALTDKKVDLRKLFRGADGTGGVFGTLSKSIEEYTKAGGLVPNAQNRLTDQLGQVSNRIGEMEVRLAIRRTALQREFTAADATLAQLNSQKGSLSALGGQSSLF